MSIFEICVNYSYDTINKYFCKLLLKYKLCNFSFSYRTLKMHGKFTTINKILFIIKSFKVRIRHTMHGSALISSQSYCECNQVTIQKLLSFILEQLS